MGGFVQGMMQLVLRQQQAEAAGGAPGVGFDDQMTKLIGATLGGLTRRASPHAPSSSGVNAC